MHPETPAVAPITPDPTSTPDWYVPGLLGRASDVPALDTALPAHAEVYPDVDDDGDPHGWAPIDDATPWHCACGEEVATGPSDARDVASDHRRHVAAAVSAWLVTGVAS